MSDEALRVKRAGVLIITSIMIAPASGVTLPVHLQCAGSQKQPVEVGWEGYPQKLVVQNQEMLMFQEHKTQTGRVIRFYRISDSGKKLALIESSDAIKLIYSEDEREVEVLCGK